MQGTAIVMRWQSHSAELKGAVLWQGSIVVMLLAGVVFVGTLLTASFGGRAAVHDIMTGQNLHFSSFCQVLLGGQQ